MNEIKTGMNEIKRCYDLVWQYRRELADVWPTPNRLDSIKFAFTEAGEAVDAELRNNQSYVRNNHKELDDLDEWADCAMMLLTALGESFKMDAVLPSLLARLSGPLYIATQICFAWDEVKRRNCDDWELRCTFALQSISRLDGMDLYSRLEKRLQRIQAKHGKETTDEQEKELHF